jgi:hypothetical protein
MTSPFTRSVEDGTKCYVWPAVLAAPPLFDAACECGRHTVTDHDPVVCQRCGSLRLTVTRLNQWDLYT